MTRTEAERLGAVMADLYTALDHQGPAREQFLHYAIAGAFSTLEAAGFKVTVTRPGEGIEASVDVTRRAKS